MLLIQGDRELYFIDRDNSIFQVDGLAFPHPVDKSRCLRDTLLDGVRSILPFEILLMNILNVTRLI